MLRLIFFEPLFKFDSEINVLVLDKETTPGKHQSGRNSGVIHSGIYYKPNSFKSNLCIRGRELLLEFLDEENIPFRLEGKIVVDNDINKLSSLEERATQLSMENVKVLEKSDIFNIKLNNSNPFILLWFIYISHFRFFLWYFGIKYGP